MSDITEEEMRDQVERTLAIFFTGNRMPHMSGDPRERVPPAKRRDLSGAADNVLALLQPALERARREERERCAVIAETAADCLMDSTFTGVAAAIRKG